MNTNTNSNEKTRENLKTIFVEENTCYYCGCNVGKEKIGHSHKCKEYLSSLLDDNIFVMPDMTVKENKDQSINGDDDDFPEQPKENIFVYVLRKLQGWAANMISMTAQSIDKLITKIGRSMGTSYFKCGSILAADVVTKFLEKYHQVIFACVRAATNYIRRVSTGYPNEIVILEFISDISFDLSYMFGLSLSGLQSILVPQAGAPEWVMPVAAVFTTFLAMFTAKNLTPDTFSSLWRTGSAIAQYISGLGGVGNFVSSSLLGYTPEKAFPRTVLFNTWLEQNHMDHNICAYKKRVGSALYRGYMEERKEWSRIDLTEHFQVKFPLLFKDNSKLMMSFPRVRMQPLCIVLQGEPGVGKTFLMHALENFSFKFMASMGMIDPAMSFHDFVYPWSEGKDHYDGYSSQPCFEFNDFGRTNETTSSSEAASTEFMKVIDSNPYLPSMAHLDDKGVCIEPMVTFVSTMIPVSRWHAHFKKCSRVGAMMRRVTAVYEIKPRSWDSSRLEMASDESHAIDDQWVITDMRTHVNVSVKAVITKIAKELMLSVKKFRTTYDEYGMMSIPTMDKEMKNIIEGVDPYWQDKINDKILEGGFTHGPEPSLPHRDDIQTKWWQSPKQKMARAILELYNNKWLYKPLMKAFIGVGMAMGCAFAFIYRNNVIDWVKKGTTLLQEGLITSKNKVHEKYDSTKQGFDNAKQGLTDTYNNNLQDFRNQYGDYFEYHCGAHDVEPNMDINGDRYIAHKALISGKWVKCFIEEGAIPQGGVKIDNVLNCNVKKRMTGNLYQNFHQDRCFVSCLNDKGQHCVYGVVLDTQHLLVPCHYLDNYKTFDFVTSHKNIRYIVREGSYKYSEFKDLDLALIRVFDFTISGGRSIWDKFCKVDNLSIGEQIQRVSPRGKIPCFVVRPRMITAYEGVEGINATAVEITGVYGDCGSVYIDSAGYIVGIHVAGNKTGQRSYCTLPPFMRLTKAAQALSDVKPPVNLSPNDGCEGVECQMDEGEKVLNDCGIDKVGKKMGVYSPINRRSDLVKIPLLTGLPDIYGVADLGFVYNETTRVPVEAYRLKKWSDKQNESLLINVKFNTHIVDNMCAQLKLKRNDALLGWDSLAAKSGEIPSINRATVAGPWFPGQAKGVFCTGDEEPKLLSEVIDHLKVLDQKLEMGESFPVVSGLSLKVERLPFEKVKEGKTRLFQPVDICKYLLDRRYFGNIVAELSTKLKNMTPVMYAATPEDIGRRVASFREHYGYSIDVTSQDNSHTHMTVLIIMYLLIKTKVVDNSGAVYMCHPKLPLLNQINRSRYILLRDTGFGQRVYVDNVFDNCAGALASGAFWTTLFNCMAGWYCIEEFKLTHPAIECVIFGDDALLIGEITESILRQSYSDAGFKITGSGIDGAIKQQHISQIVFCGRIYDENVARMNLTHCRLAKILHFASTKNSRLAFLSSIVNFLNEICWEKQKFYLQTIETIECNDVKLITYMPDIFKINTNIREKNFWSEYECDNDCITRHGYFACCVNQWLDIIEFEKMVFRCMHPVVADIQVVEDDFLGEIVAQMDKGKQKEEESNKDDEAVPSVAEIGDVTGDDMIDLVTTDIQDASRADESVKEHEYSFVRDIISPYWSRPVRIASLRWGMEHDRNASIFNFNAFGDIIDSAANYQMKLANTVGIRGIVKVFCVVNSNPFQAGALVLFGSPGARVPEFIGSVLSGPHSIITAGANQTASFEVPYNREILFANTNAYGRNDQNQYFDWIRFDLRVLSPLVVADNANPYVNVQILVQLVDVEVMQGSVTMFDIQPQAQGIKKQIPIIASRDDKSMSFKDKIMATSGAVVKTLGNVASIVSTVAPLAGMFLSKADNVANVQPVSHQTAHAIANYNGIDESKKAALNATAGTLPHPQLFPNTVGGPATMIRNLAKRPGLVGFQSYGVDTEADAIIDGYSVSTFYRSNVQDDRLVVPPLTYISQHFEYWRGSITYRFTLFKTAFHTGSLEILVDYGNTFIEPTSASRAVNLHRVYWDITSQSVLTVTIPYRRSTHWAQYASNAHSPKMYLKAVQPLIANPNVCSSIDIMIEVWSEDLQVAWPQRSIRLAGETAGRVPVSAADIKDIRKFKEQQQHGSNCNNVQIVAQMNDVLSKVSATPATSIQGNFDPAITTHDLSDHVLLGNVLPRPDPDSFAYRYIAGDEVVDVTQVLKRFMNTENEWGLVQSGFTWNANTIFKNNGVSFTFGYWPYYFESLAAMFTYGTGGFRLKFLPVGGTGDSAQVNVFVPGGDNLSPGTPSMFQNAYTVPVMEVEVPPVTNMFYYRLQMDGVVGTTGSANRPNLTVEYKLNSNSEAIVYFAFDDNVSWGGYNYLPTVYSTGHSNANVPAPLLEKIIP